MDQKFYQKRDSQKYSSHLKLYSFLLIFKILGLAPSAINISKILKSTINRNISYPYKVSKFGLFYNVLLIFTLSAYVIVLMYKDMFIPNYVNSNSLKIVVTNLRFFGTTGVIIIWFVYIYYQKTVVQIANDLYTVDTNLEICKYYSLINDSHAYYIIIANSVFSGGLLLLNLVLYHSLVMPLWMVPCIISSYFLAQYALFLSIITQRFNSINKTILKFGNMHSDDELSTIFTDKITLCKPIINDIENVNHANLELCNICNKMTDFYTFPTLITVIYFMIISMMNLYFLVGATITQSDELTLFDAMESGATVLVAVNCFIALNINFVRIERKVRVYTYEYVINYFNPESKFKS